MVSPLLPRAQWGARAARGTPPAINAEGITVHWWGSALWPGADRSSPARFRDTTDHNRCPSIVRAGQAYHMDHNRWIDIAYSSGPCPHGVRFDMRGPGRRTAAQGTNAGNARSHAVVYLAGPGDPLTDEAKQAFLDEQARLGHLRWDHGDWRDTDCAGPFIRRWKAQGWPAPVQPPTPSQGEGFLSALNRDQQLATWRGARQIDDLRAEVQDLRTMIAEQGRVMLVAAADWQAGDPVYVTDFIAKAEYRHGGPLHSLIRYLRGGSGLDPNAVRIPREALDEIPTVHSG